MANCSLRILLCVRSYWTIQVGDMLWGVWAARINPSWLAPALFPHFHTQLPCLKTLRHNPGQLIKPVQTTQECETGTKWLYLFWSPEPVVVLGGHLPATVAWEVEKGSLQQGWETEKGFWPFNHSGQPLAEPLRQKTCQKTQWNKKSTDWTKGSIFSGHLPVPWQSHLPLPPSWILINRGIS